MKILPIILLTCAASAAAQTYNVTYQSNEGGVFGNTYIVAFCNRSSPCSVQTRYISWHSVTENQNVPPGHKIRIGPLKIPKELGPGLSRGIMVEITLRGVIAWHGEQRGIRECCLVQDLGPVLVEQVDGVDLNPLWRITPPLVTLN